MSRILLHTIALNKVDLLRRMIESVDTRHDWRMLIHWVSKDTAIQEYLETLKKINHSPPSVDETPAQAFDPEKGGSRFEIINVGYNIGVAHCFNEALDRYTGRDSHSYDHILLVNSDIQFGPGDIDRMVEHAECFPDKLITVCGTHGRHVSEWKRMNISHGMACAIVPRKMFEEVGYFDENFFPAYNEDCDYMTRVWLHRKLGTIQPGFDKIGAKDSPLVACVISGNTHHEGSSAILSDRKLFRQNLDTHGANLEYYNAKWGGLNDYETYTKAFDQWTDFYISKKARQNPYPAYWDRTEEKHRFYAKINVGLQHHEIVVTHCGKLGDFISVLPVISWISKNYTDNIHLVLNGRFEPFKKIKSLIDLQPMIKKFTLVETAELKYGCGGQPYKFDPNDFGVRCAEWYNLGFRYYPRKQHCSVFAADEHGFGVDWKFVLKLGDVEPTDEILCSEERVHKMVPGSQLIDLNQDILFNARRMKAAKERHCWQAGMCHILEWANVKPIYLYRDSVQIDIEQYSRSMSGFKWMNSKRSFLKKLNYYGFRGRLMLQEHFFPADQKLRRPFNFS